jgi:hypothetical protein
MCVDAWTGKVVSGGNTSGVADKSWVQHVIPRVDRCSAVGGVDIAW